MSDNIQELRTVFSGDSRSYDEATERVIGGMNRQERAAHSTAKALDLYNRSLQNVADTKKKASGGHGGDKHGGGDFAWGVHDLMEGRVANGAFRLATAFGIAGGAATGALLAINQLRKGYEAYSETVESTLALEKAMGAGRRSAVERNDLYRPLAAILPRYALDLGEGPEAARASLGGIAEQRTAIQAAIEKEQNSRGYVAAWVDNAAWMYTGHSRLHESVDREGKANDQLAELDARSAGIIGRQTAAKRLTAYDSTLAGGLEVSGTQHATEMEDLEDAYHSGKMGIAERNARIRQIDQDRDIRNRNLELEHETRRRERRLQARDVWARGRGTHVAETLADNRMVAAQEELASAPNKEGRDAARAKYLTSWEQKREAGFSWRERDASVETAQKVADVRGSTESRALATAELELQKARDLLSIAKERGADEVKAANVAVAGAQRTLDLLKEQQAVQRVNYENQLGKMPRDLAAAGALLRGASPEEAQRAQLASAVDDAKDDVKAARKNKRLQHYSVESRAAFAAAEQTRDQAQIALGIHDREFARDRGRQLDQAHGETAALRYSVVGRDDLAGLTRDRAQTRLGIEDADFHKNPGLAAELGEQQQLRERRMLTEKYLNPDGTRRNPAAVQAEEVANRRRAMRINAFFGTTPDADVKGGLESGSGIETAASRHLYALNYAHDPAARLANARGPRFGGTALSHGATKVGDMGLGLVGVAHGMDGGILSARDALTGEKLNAGQIHEREAQAKKTADMHAANAKDDRSDREIQQEIFKLLNDRLPSTTAK